MLPAGAKSRIKPVFVLVLCVALTTGVRARPIESWLEQQHRGLSFQQYDYSCGTASIINLIKLAGGVEHSEEALLKNYFLFLTSEQQEKIKSQGLSLYDLAAIMKLAGYTGTGVRFDRAKVTAMNQPMIVYLDLGDVKHFAVLEKLTGERAILLDPSRGRISMPAYKFFSEWNGVALLVDEFPETPEHPGTEDRPFVAEAARRALR